MPLSGSKANTPNVALLAEGVDRNTMTAIGITGTLDVALLAEGVDRNTTPERQELRVVCRPPRGGRG